MAESTIKQGQNNLSTTTPSPIYLNNNIKSEENCNGGTHVSDTTISANRENPPDLSMRQKLFNQLQDAFKNDSNVSSNGTTSLFNELKTGLAASEDLQKLISLQQVQKLTLENNQQNNVDNPVVNAPLNLSLGATVSTKSNTNDNLDVGSTATMNNTDHMRSSSIPLLGPQQTVPMPQFILASGQLMQGIQGAQLLIPTSQGLATQTILTIPVSHVNSNEQMVNLALSNGQTMMTTLANLQAIAQSNFLNQPINGTNLIGPLTNPTNESVKQLLQNSTISQTAPRLPLTQPAPYHHVSPAPKHKIELNQSHVSRSPSPLENEDSGKKTFVKEENLRPAPQESSETSTADLLLDSPNQPTINETNSNVVDGINLDEIKNFAKAFKLRRLSLGLTQTQVGQALSVTEGPAYSQSAICSALASQMFAAAQLSTQQQAIFEKLDITPKSAQKIKPVLERWMREAEERYKSGQNHLTDFIGIEPSKKRKRRTSFTPQALELLNAHFERNTHPSGTEITGLAHQLGYEREVIRIWFCNKRQALKNTVRMMSKEMV